jgi:protein-tyrosine phosphatase
MRLPDPLERGINNRFGSKRGLVNLMRARAGYLLGRFQRESRVDFSGVERLVFICSGNICRSPFGEFYARANDLAADSYGLHTRGGDPADPRAIDFAAGIGIDMTAHRTRNIREYEPAPGDLLLVMEPGQYQELEQIHTDRKWPLSIQLSILSLFKKKPSPYLHDPFGASPEFFDYCERQVMEAVDGIAGRMRGG